MLATRKCLKVCLASSIMLLAACSNRSEIVSAPPVYLGVPQGLLARCAVNDVPLVTTGDIVESRNRYKKGFDKCAAQVDKIRDYDAKARGVK